MPFILIWEESVYVRKVGDILDSRTDAPRDELVDRDFSSIDFQVTNSSSFRAMYVGGETYNLSNAHG